MATVPYVKIGDLTSMLPGLQNLSAANASLTLLAASVSELANRYTGRTFWIQSYTEAVKGRGQTQIIPLQQPVKSVVGLTISSGSFNTSFSQVPSDINGVPLMGIQGYWLGVDNDGVTTIYLSGCTRIPDSTTPRAFVTYSAGYAALTGGENNGPVYLDLPGDFYQALLYECAVRYKELSRLGAKQEMSGPGQSMVFNVMDLQSQTKGVLNRYKRSWMQMA